MSGHSKWSTIKRKKAATDAKKGKIFTKALREVQVAARAGGSSTETNARLRTAVLAARALSVPLDNIERAIKRGAGELEGVEYEEITYEGYGPGGVAVLVRALTDNKNRTVSEVRHAFTKCNGNLGGANAVAYLFSEQGILSIPKKAISEEKILEVALEAGARDVQDADDSWEVVTEVKDYQKVRDSLELLSTDISGEVRLVPSTTIRVTGRDAELILKLMEMLDDLDDVQQAVSNFEIDDSEFEKLSQ